MLDLAEFKVLLKEQLSIPANKVRDNLPKQLIKVLDNLPYQPIRYSITYSINKVDDNLHQILKFYISHLACCHIVVYELLKYISL